MFFRQDTLAKSRYDVSFLPRFRLFLSTLCVEQHSTDQSSVSFIIQVNHSLPDSTAVHKPGHFKFIVKRYCTDLLIFNAVGLVTYIETGRFFSSFEPRPVVRRAAIASGPTRSSALRYCTLLLRSLALGALCARIRFFSLKRSAAAKVSICKANGIKELYPHDYYNCHTMSFNLFFHAHQPHSDIKRRVQPYRSSLNSTIDGLAPR